MARVKDLRRRAQTWLVGELGWILLRLLRLTVRPRLVNRELFDRLRKERRTFLVAFWHGRLLYPAMAHSNLGITPLISLSRDGEMIARTIEKLGYRTIRGSGSRGSRKAMDEMIALAKQPGQILVITPDGPRGPRHVLQPGTVKIAREAGIPIMPLSFATAKPIVFGSWDRFQFWKPFSRLVMIYGDLIELDPEGDFAEQVEMVRQRLIEIEERCDTCFGKDGRDNG